MSYGQSHIRRWDTEPTCRQGAARWLQVVVAGAVIGFALPARGADSTCNDAYAATQTLRREGKLRAARVQALACGQDVCTTTVRTDCAQWLQEIERATPSVLVDARDSAGKELADVNVMIDGVTVAMRLDGKQILVDPGGRDFRFEHAGQVTGIPVLVREGEKFRILHVTFSEVDRGDTPSETGPIDPSRSSATATPAPQALGDRADKQAPARAIPAATYVLGAASMVGLGAFAVLATTAYAREQDLRHTCGPTHTCDPSDIDSVHTRYVLADVALGASVISMAAAAIVLFTAPQSEPHKAYTTDALAVRMAILPRSARLVVDGRF